MANKLLKFTAAQIDAAIEKIIGLDTSIITNLINNKYDNATLSGNILKLYANGVEKKSLTLPTSSGGGSGTPGTDGREIELSVQAGYIAWRYKGDSSWTNLVSLESLKGPTGATGATGPVGASGSNGTNATINGMETLEIVAGSNISIEKNTTNKTITINSTVVGGGSGNVDLSNYYTKGQVDTKDTEIKNTIGTLGSLATTEKTNVVGAVNEVTTQLETVKTNLPSDLKLTGNKLQLKKADGTILGTGIDLPIGDGSGGSVDLTAYQTKEDNTLTTTNKTIVGGINEIKSSLDNNTSNEGLSFDNSNVMRSIVTDVDETIIKQDYLGGYIEIQPDSWDGEITATDNTTKTWGFPMSLLGTEQARLRDMILHGKGSNMMYIRFPLGYAYRGYRNIDTTTKLAKNIGERFKGQNASLRLFFENISNSGGGLAPEYWCPPPYWLTSGSYHGSNQIRAGGSYPMTTTLASIKTSDASQYNAQIEAFTNAIVDDLEYLHQNIAPVRMFGLQNEPAHTSLNYGACKYDAQTYNDVLSVLYPKIQASEILKTYNDEKNEVKLLVASSDEGKPFEGIGKIFIQNHADWIWGYTHHLMRMASGENSGIDVGAEGYKSLEFAELKGNKTNVFINEYEYFTLNFGTDEFRCSNNMLHLINEAVYGEAQILHPVIHICKPLGQTSSQTNTKGYCLFETNLKGEYGVSPKDVKNTFNLGKGTFIPNITMYNSWAMFGENLPVGAYLIGDYSKKINNGGWCVYKHSGKLYIFIANNSKEDISITLNFSKNKLFNGKMYSLEYCGNKIKQKRGNTIEFVVPANSGQVWIENDETVYNITKTPCTKIKLSSSSLTFNDNNPQSLNYTLTPIHTTDTVSLKAMPEGVISISGNNIIPISRGECVITARCGNQTDVCNVAVNVDIEAVTFNLTGGGISSTTGLDEDSNIKMRSDYVAIDKKITIYSDVFNTSYGIGKYDGFVIRTYDVDKNFLNSNPSGITHTNTPITINYTSNVKFIRFVIVNSKNGTQCNIKENDIIMIDNTEHFVRITT